MFIPFRACGDVDINCMHYPLQKGIYDFISAYHCYWSGLILGLPILMAQVRAPGLSFLTRIREDKQQMQSAELSAPYLLLHNILALFPF
jgi:hypothetical protein